jgi:hypothetical protein
MSITALQVVKAPAILPVSLVEAKRHLRQSSNAEDAHINDLIRAATAWAETETRRRLISQTVKLSMDRFPRTGESVITRGDVFDSVFFVGSDSLGRVFASASRDRMIFLPGGVTTAVEKIDYIDEAGNLQTLSGPTSATPGTDFQEDLTDNEGAFLMPPDDGFWPGVDLGVMNAVVIQYTVGYSVSPDEVPEDIKAAIKFRVGDLFNIRSTSDGKAGGIGDTATNLIEPHRIQMF